MSEPTDHSITAFKIQLKRLDVKSKGAGEDHLLDRLPAAFHKIDEVADAQRADLTHRWSDT